MKYFFGFILLIVVAAAACKTAIPIELRHIPTIRVMVIDTGIDDTNEQLKPYISTQADPGELGDNHGHGTHVTGVILYGAKLNDPVCKDVEVYSCRSFVEWSHSLTYCLTKARELAIDVVNISGGGYERIAAEGPAMKKLKARVIAAAGNGEKVDDIVIPRNLTKRPYYPASLGYSNITVVGNGKSSKDRAPTSNYGLADMVWRDGNSITSYIPGGKATMGGTSQATAIYTHEVLQRMCDQRRRSAR